MRLCKAHYTHAHSQESDWERCPYCEIESLRAEVARLWGVIGRARSVMDTIVNKGEALEGVTAIRVQAGCILAEIRALSENETQNGGSKKPPGPSCGTLRDALEALVDATPDTDAWRHAHSEACELLPKRE